MELTPKVSGESEAKAILKGAIRRAHIYGDQLLQKKHQRMHVKKTRSMKVLNEFLEEEISWYGDFLVTCNKFKKYGIGTSKHFRAEFSAIEPELKYADEIGDLCRYMICYFDSRKLAQCKVNAIRRFSSQFYFHEHFLIRCIHRLNKRTIGEIASEIYPVIEWLVTQNVPLSKFDETNYFVFKEFVAITQKLPHGKGLVFKTILLIDRLTPEDQKKFTSAIEIHTNVKNKSVAAIQVNAHGNIVRQISSSSGQSLLNSLSERSIWAQDIYESNALVSTQVDQKTNWLIPYTFQFLLLNNYQALP